MSKIDYKSAGVDIDAGNEAVENIKEIVGTTFTNNVLTGIGSFGSLFRLKSLLSNYKDPVMVQSIDGVGTKTIIARKLNMFNTIGIDLLSACANDIIVMGATPLTFLDYIANDKLKPEVIKEIVSGIVGACKSTGVSLVGGETAEMPDTYLPGEHDLVGVITGIVEKDKIIDGSKINPGDLIFGLPSSGLHTNGFSLARKIFFDIGGYKATDSHSDLKKNIGETLLEPHINYTNPILALLKNGVLIKGIAHITGGGLLENVPRILPGNCNAVINAGSWPILRIFDVMQKIGDISQKEMYRAFNMGIGMVVIVNPVEALKLKKIIKDHSPIFEIGLITEGNKRFVLKQNQ